MTRYEVIISFDDIDISKTNRIPVLIGGNINNAPFLYMYKFDLPNLPQNATAVEGTPILQISQTFTLQGIKMVVILGGLGFFSIIKPTQVRMCTLM